MSHLPLGARPTNDQPRRRQSSNMTGWQSVIALGIAALTVLGCGWGAVFYLVNR